MGPWEGECSVGDNATRPHDICQEAFGAPGGTRRLRHGG